MNMVRVRPGVYVMDEVPSERNPQSFSWITSRPLLSNAEVEAVARVFWFSFENDKWCGVEAFVVLSDVERKITPQFYPGLNFIEGATEIKAAINALVKRGLLRLRKVCVSGPYALCPTPETIGYLTPKK